MERWAPSVLACNCLGQGKPRQGEDVSITDWHRHVSNSMSEDSLSLLRSKSVRGAGAHSTADLTQSDGRASRAERFEFYAVVI
ncbi:hypothetical protein EVAR_92554_1 [Eumeta japonica]|uniref:Uncharacterized protein n=1 Tax=Eumeta variegata TaxID=151549 RepID=A0A4C1SX71_EUMVA|nr:hypothetical protein EVAR_92554_1 [Eumeta japonica]